MSFLGGGWGLGQVLGGLGTFWEVSRCYRCGFAKARLGKHLWPQRARGRPKRSREESRSDTLPKPKP